MTLKTEATVNLLNGSQSKDNGLPEEITGRQRPPIGDLLRDLRGNRTLRDVEQGAGIPNSYLSNVESGGKRPGLKTLAKLADYYGVPLDELLEVAGLPHAKNTQSSAVSALDIHRSFHFLMADPGLRQYERPNDRLSTDTQRFIVQLYEHFTGKRLL
jgi:transcriptional regulator with XRE-family HTH domain